MDQVMDAMMPFFTLAIVLFGIETVFDMFLREHKKAKREDGVKLHVDHVVPVSRGGKSTMDNLQTLCEDCNCGKGNKYVE